MNPRLLSSKSCIIPFSLLDTERYWVNAKVYFSYLPMTDTCWALLNSRIVWWYIYRKWTHMKDEALTVQKQKVLSLPIPEVAPDLCARGFGEIWSIQASATTHDDDQWTS